MIAACALWLGARWLFLLNFETSAFREASQSGGLVRFGVGSVLFEFCWPGCAPGGAVTFIFRKMKVTKAKAPLLPASLRFAPGNLRCSVVGCTAKLSTLRWSSVRTDAVSQFTWQLHSAMQLLSPRPALLGAGKRGGPEYRDSFLVGWAL